MHMGQMASTNARPSKFYTIQRVNGNGGNGKGDGVAGPHKHTLEESDRVKKNSVQRWLMKNERERKKSQVRSLFIHVLDALSMSHSSRTSFLAVLGCTSAAYLSVPVARACYSSNQALQGIRGSPLPIMCMASC